MSNSRLDHHSPKYPDAVGNFGLSYHLEKELEVRAGDSLQFTASFDVRTNLDDSRFYI